MPEPIAAEPQLYTPLYELGQLLASYGYVPRATFRPGAAVVHVQDEARQRMSRHGQSSHQRNPHNRCEFLAGCDLAFLLIRLRMHCDVQSVNYSRPYLYVGHERLCGALQRCHSITLISANQWNRSVDVTIRRRRYGETSLPREEFVKRRTRRRICRWRRSTPWNRRAHLSSGYVELF